MSIHTYNRIVPTCHGRGQTRSTVEPPEGCTLALFSSGVCEAYMYNRHLMHSGYTIHHARHICGVVMCHSTHSHLCSHHLRPSHDRYVMIGVVMILRKKRFVSEQNTRTRARARRPPACRRAGRRMCRPAWSSRGTCGARAAREKRPPVSTGAARPDGKG